MGQADEITVITETVDNARILRPQGEIDLSRAPALRVHLDQSGGGAVAKVIVDLADVPYMDSSGVATLVEAMQVARRKGYQLVLCSLQERVRSIFEIARLDMVFTIVETTDNALAV